MGWPRKPALSLGLCATQAARLRPSVFCNGDIGAIDPNCNDDAAANVGEAKSPSAAPKFEANVELGMLHADRNPNTKSLKAGPMGPFAHPD